MSDSEGQFAGFSSNWASVHAFCNVVNLDGRAFGSSTLTLVILAWVPSWPIPDDRSADSPPLAGLAPSALLVFPLVETLNCGANFRLAQLATSNGIDTGELAPSALLMLPVTCIALHDVGLNVNPGRVMLTLTCLICNGMPSMIDGIA